MNRTPLGVRDLVGCGVAVVMLAASWAVVLVVVWAAAELIGALL